MDTEQRTGRRWVDAPRRRRGDGFTLIEVLIAIVLVGILSAVAVVGIGRLTDRASSASCAASMDAARVAAGTYYAGQLRYPASFGELTAGGAGPALVLPAGVSIVGDALVGGSWALTMVPGSPPTFSCGPSGGGPVTTTTAAAATTTTAAATTTTAAATTTTAPSNGVTATGGNAGDRLYYGESIVALTNSAPITAMTVTISVRHTAGVTSMGGYTNFWSGAVSTSSTVIGGAIVYTFTLNPGQTIVVGSWTLNAQWSGTGTQHPVAGDTWTVSTTSQGRSSTITGGF
ncbi:MAG: type II secretion system protein [Ilumatobacteraceae bacterium]